MASDAVKALHAIRCPACDALLTRTNLTLGMRQNFMCPTCIKKELKTWVWVCIVAADGTDKPPGAILCANCDHPLTRTNLVPGMRQNLMCPKCTRPEQRTWVWVCVVAVAAPEPA